MREDLRSVAVDLLACFNAWEPDVRVLGNVRACDGAALMCELLGEEKDQAQRWLKEREQMLSNRDKDCELATSILRGAISALHSMHDPIQAGARQQIQMAIDVLCNGSQASLT